MGFSGANNIGIKNSKGDYIFLLNADTIIEKNTIKQLVDVLETYPNSAAVSPKIIYHKEKLIQYAGTTEFSKFTLKNKHIGNKKIDNGDYDKIEKTAFNHGAAMMVKKSIIDKVGMMPEEYFLYYEELDWCNSFKRNGYDLYYNGLTKIYHKESATTGKIKGLKSYYLNRNRVLFTIRNYNGLERIITIFYLMMISFPKNLIYNINDMTTLKSIVRAFIWNIKKIFKL